MESVSRDALIILNVLLVCFQLQNANAILDQSHQPYHYLVEGVRVRDQQISKQKDHITTLEADVRSQQMQYKFSCCMYMYVIGKRSTST